MSEATVDTPSSAATRMAGLFAPIQALLSKTEGMRLAGERWLPKEPREDYMHYQRRLERSFLKPLYEDGADKLVAKPFSVPVKVTGKLPEQLAGLQDDVDGRGTDLTSFLRQCFADGVYWGSMHGVVDAADVPSDLNAGEERELGVRPYFCRLDVPSVIGARETVPERGMPYLSQLRVRESSVEPDGAFGEKKVDAVRVWQTDGASTTATVWTKAAGASAYVPGEAKPVTYPYGIPHAYAAFAPVGPYESVPPLGSLASVNMMHWQSYSDHRNWLKVVRTILYFGAGWSKEEIDKGITLAASQAKLIDKKDATLTILESSGSAMAVSFKDIEDVEQTAQLLAMMPYVQSAVAQTATAKSYDEERGICVLQSWVRTTERFAEQLYRIAADWYGVELPEDFEVNIFSDFGLSMKAMQNAQHLIAMRAAKQITQETFLAHMQSLGILGDAIDVKAEIERTRSEADEAAAKLAGLSGMFTDGPGGGPPTPGGEPADDDDGREAA